MINPTNKYTTTKDKSGKQITRRYSSEEMFSFTLYVYFCIQRISKTDSSKYKIRYQYAPTTFVNAIFYLEGVTTTQAESF